MENLQKLMLGREKRGHEIRAVVGDGTGRVSVSELPQHIWIRPYNRESPVVAFAPSGSYPNNALVRAAVKFVGAKTFYTVLSADHEAYGHGWTPTQVPTIGAHASQHQYISSGSDVVLVHPHQFTPLLMYPTSPASMKVYICPGYWRYGGILRYWGGGESLDLTTYLPPTDYAHYVLVYFDAVTMTLNYQTSIAFAASLAIPDPYTFNMPSPALSVVVGLILLRHDTTMIETDMVFPFRSILNVEFADVASQTWMLAARSDSLWQSTGGYSWSQIGSGDSYLETGILHVAIVSAEKWLVFREQTTPNVNDPIVYGTSDAGATWAIKQEGFTHTQGTATWGASTIALDPTDADKIMVVIHPTNESAQPMVFVSLDGGDLWAPISNTGLPTFDEDTDEYRAVSAAVKDWTLPYACIAFESEGLYLKNGVTSWAQQDLGSDAEVYAVCADASGSDSWVASTQIYVMFTDNGWSTYDGSLLDNSDILSETCPYIYQHPSNLPQFAVGGRMGPHVTFDGSTFQQVEAMQVGQVGKVLTGVRGQPGTLFFTRESDGQLFVSPDACAYSAVALALDEVIAFSGLYGETGGGGFFFTESSWLEHWLWS